MDIKQILEKDENGNYKLSEEERLNEALKIEGIKDADLLRISSSLTDESKLKLLSKFDPKDEKIYYILSEIEDISNLKKGMEYYKAYSTGIFVSRKVNIVRGYKEETQLELLPYVDDEDDKRFIIGKFKDESHKIQALETVKSINIKLRIVTELTSDDDKINLLNSFEKEEDKLQIILSIRDENKKADSIKYITDEKIMTRLILSLPEEKGIKLVGRLNDESNIARVIASLTNEQKKYELFSKISDLKLLSRCSEYLSDENKIKLLNRFDPKDENIYYILLEIKDIEYLKKGMEYYKAYSVGVFLSTKVNLVQRYKEETQLELLPYVDDERDKKYIIDKFKSEDMKIKGLEYLKGANEIAEIINTFTDSKKIMELSEKISDPIVLAQITKNLQDPDRIKILKRIDPEAKQMFYILSLIKDVNYLMEGMKYAKCYRHVRSFLGYKVSLIKDYDENTQSQFLPYIEEERDRLYIIENFKNQELKYNCLNYLEGYKNKSSIIHSLGQELRDKATKELVEEYANLDDINKIIYLTGSTNNIMEELKKIENSILEIDNKEEFIKRFNGLGYGSKCRVIFKDSQFIDDNIIKEVLNLAKIETDKINLMLKLTEDERIKYYDENKLEQNINISKFIMSLSLENQFKYGKEVQQIFDMGDYESISFLFPETMNQILDSKQIKVLDEYKKIQDIGLKQHFGEYIHSNYDELDEEKITSISQLVFNIYTSNSEEISKQSDSFITSMLSSEDPLKSFEKVEQIFLKNHLPKFAKAYITFLTVHPEFSSYAFKNSKNGGHTVSSPVLNDISSLHRKALVLTDLIKGSLGSNSNNFLSYLDSLEKGDELYLNNKNNDYNSLNEKDKETLKDFRDSIFTLYDNYLRKVKIEMTSDVIRDLNKINDIITKNSNQNLADLIIAGYCHFIGINTIKEARKYANEVVLKSNKNNIKRYQDNNYKIEQGDFVKGFDINYFFDMVSNGVVAQDYLGADMKTDATALDTDLSRIWKDTTGMTLEEIINLKDKDSGFFGQGYIVIKDDPNKIRLTKKSSNEDYSRVDVVEKKDIFEDKLEAFSNGTSNNISNPYGIRTGFSISNIDFIVFDEQGGNYRENIYKLILPLAMNGIYVPIIAKNDGRVLFSLEEYEKLRSKMSGLKQYGINDYDLSKNIEGEQFELIASEIDNSNKVINDIKQKIFDTLSEGLGNEFNLIPNISGKLEKGEIQVLDTGSTGRGTNALYEGDYDFVVRIDRDIDIYDNIKNDFIKKITSKFDIVNPGKNVNGDIKEMVVRIDDKEYPIDLSFVRKTDKVSYSTEMCVKDRLSTIKEKYPDKYKLVLANIIYAKKLLKKNECYKKGSYAQGGLGGIGVENWILQNGGSLYDAAKEFLSNAIENNKEVDFMTFISKYQIWDYGENFYTERQNRTSSYKNNLHDNFVGNNLTEQGYNKMISALKEFVKNYEAGCLETLEEKNSKTI